MKIGAPHHVAATVPVPSTAKHGSEKSPLPDQFDASSSNNKQTAPSENQQEQCLPKVRISTKTGKPKFTSVATPGLDTARETPAQLSPQTENADAATKIATLSQDASNKLILLAHELAAACQKNTSPTAQASNCSNPTVLAMRTLRNFIADSVKIPAGAVGLKQVKSLLMSTTLPKEVSQTTLSERNRRVLLPLQLLIATLPREQIQKGMALAKLDSLVTTHSRNLT